MNKLKLNLESLAVESFDTTAAEQDQGTVFGEQCTCPGAPTCNATCPQTCAQTCEGGSCVGSCDSCGGTCYCPSHVCEFTWGSCTCPEN